ncbi:ribosome biogenesis protein C1orf109 homolog [Hyla sarda]|uniref:ribosome biogenesis protein C1orf109 homolog n=1 Tax=Hyla sarda TaxID=327740 RepID=UPI0024C3E59F|nr:ribosome biogenesis protein C1orf109 homolog [Hyla sarda]XP_056413105.1 ribosome biogenesis protein C1orf109 homolog [Hyla sarda]
MPEDAALLSVLQSLRQCFDAIERQQEEWNCAILESGPLVSSLSNLAEQLQACQKVTFSKTPLGGFTDLQDRLRYKLEAAVNITLEKLNDKMCILQRVRDAVSQQVGSVMYVYEVNAEKLSFEATLERTPHSPSMADMLEWLQDTERYYRTQYLQRKLLLQIQDNRVSEIKNLTHSWERLNDKFTTKQHLVKDMLLNVSFFREATN